MEATVAERGQITLPKAVRDALGLTKGTTLKVELDGGRIILRKDVSEALRKVRGIVDILGGGRVYGEKRQTVQLRARMRCARIRKGQPLPGAHVFGQGGYFRCMGLAPVGVGVIAGPVQEIVIVGRQFFPGLELKQGHVGQIRQPLA